MDECTGCWILDLFSHPRDGLVLYLLEEHGARLRLHCLFPVTCYVAGLNYRLPARFPDLTWYEVEIPLALRFWAQSRAFPFARYRVAVEEGRGQHLEPLESP